MKSRTALWIVLVLSATLLVGCGSLNSKETGSAPAADVSRGYGEMAPEEPAPAVGRQDEVGTIAAALEDRKLILNAELDVKVKKAEEAVARLSEAARENGGFVQQTRQSGTREQGIRVDMVVRVPTEKYGSLVALVSGLGEVTDRSEWTDDVTEEYVDLEARIKTLQVHLEQLQKLYERSGSIDEMIKLEQEIARVTADLESLQGRMRVLSNRVQLSTVTVHLYEPEAPAPIEPADSVWERMQEGFVTSWNTMINATTNLFVVLAMLVPVLLYLGVLAGVIYLIYRVLRGRKRPPAPPAPPLE